MTTTQNYVDARTARELAAELGLDVEITIADDGDLVLTFGGGEVEQCATLEAACETLRGYAAGSL